MARNNSFVPVESQGQDIESDEDLDAGDDGIFDDEDSIFDDGGSGEGSFADQTSTFSTPADPRADHSNALTTREMEARRYEDPKPPQSMPVARQVYNMRSGFKQPKRALVARFDDQGRPLVAYYVNGKQTETFRLPTPEELQTLQTKGRIVKGGIGQVPSEGGGLPWKKIAVAGAAVAAAGAAYYFWKKRKTDDANTTVETVGEIDDSTDDEQEDEE
jgi:hypothetical protein